jgi:glycerol-3-phosphate dehydrogenase (NAD(P)+)
MKINSEIDSNNYRIGVVGAGSWGTAIADLLACKEFETHLWVFEKEVKDHIEQFHENKLYLPDHQLSPNLSASNDLADVVSDKHLIVIVVPSHVMRDVTRQMAGHLSAGTIIASEEVAQKMPTSITVACRNPEIAARVQYVFATPYFRVYTSADIVGVELGGSVKNVIAIASGMLDGLGMGLNTRAALITRGMTEVRRLGLHLGANPRTFTGLAGFGDLVLTCTGNLSRNYSVGIKLGQGKKLQQILAEMHMVAEGVKTAKSVYNFSRKLGVEMPICHEIYRILYEDLAPKEALYRLMTRTLKQELDEE